MRIVFMGTPEFAVPVLEALISGGHTVAATVSQPDREKDKKGKLIPTPVRIYSEEKGIPCLQYDKISEHAEELALLRPDVIITAAFGQLLRPEVLRLAPFGVLNVHASLLPKYRGSSPVQSALLAGDRETGVTIMQTEAGMDTGPVLSAVTVPIAEEDTAASLSAKLSVAGAELLVKTLPAYVEGRILPVPQSEKEATHCKKIVKADANIDWKLSSHEIACAVRAFNPWPIAFTYWEGTPLKIYAAQESDLSLGTSGTMAAIGKGLYVACGEGSLRLLSVQLPGKRVVTAEEFLRGHKISESSVCKNA